jgi:hypothetical protein
MHTVDALQASLELAQRAGYEIRNEWLGGSGGGGCELNGRKLLFLDLALGPLEQLEIVLDTLRRDPAINPGSPGSAR